MLPIGDIGDILLLVTDNILFHRFPKLQNLLLKILYVQVEHDSTEHAYVVLLTYIN